jgi:Histone RNA hairpin-binding protein RNA-binding domain
LNKTMATLSASDKDRKRASESEHQARTACFQGINGYNAVGDRSKRSKLDGGSNANLIVPLSATKMLDRNSLNTSLSGTCLTKQNPRIMSRYRAVMKGKNTPGYEEYRRQVPLPLRKPRSTDTPATPDHTLDIPNKRWQGLIRAWYVWTKDIIVHVFNVFLTVSFPA